MNCLLKPGKVKAKIIRTISAVEGRRRDERALIGPVPDESGSDLNDLLM